MTLEQRAQAIEQAVQRRTGDPELAEEIARLALEHLVVGSTTSRRLSRSCRRTLVLDGEVAIFVEQLRSRFDGLREPGRAAVASPPVYMAFDLLYRDGRDLSARPLAHRRLRLEGLSLAASCSSRFGGSRPTVWPRGSRSSSAATRAMWPRTRPARTRAARHGDG